MRKVILYLTLSLDGYIADADGGVGWLAGAPGEDYGYRDFYAGISAVLLGKKTYEQVVGWGGTFPYPDKPVYVFTSDPEVGVAAPNVLPVHEPADAFVARLKLESGDPIWLCGGGALARSLLVARLVDELDLFVQPVILGDGIPLFAPGLERTSLELIDARAWPAGLTEARYRVLSPWRPPDRTDSY